MRQKPDKKSIGFCERRSFPSREKKNIHRHLRSTDNKIYLRYILFLNCIDCWPAPGKKSYVIISCQFRVLLFFILTSLRRSLELSASRGATDDPVSRSDARPLSSLVAGSWVSDNPCKNNTCVAIKTKTMETRYKWLR